MQVHGALVHGLKIRHVIVGHGLLTVGVAPGKPPIAPGSNDAESRKLLLDRLHGCVIYFGVADIEVIVIALRLLVTSIDLSLNRNRKLGI